MICEADSVLNAGRTAGIVLFLVMFMILWFFISLKPLFLLVISEPKTKRYRNKEAQPNISNTNSTSALDDKNHGAGSVGQRKPLMKKLKARLVEIGSAIKSSW